MALLFKYPLTLGSNNEEEGNHHIITFVALKYNENRGKDSLGDEVNLYITLTYIYLNILINYDIIKNT